MRGTEPAPADAVSFSRILLFSVKKRENLFFAA